MSLNTDTNSSNSGNLSSIYNGPGLQLRGGSYERYSEFASDAYDVEYRVGRATEQELRQTPTTRGPQISYAISAMIVAPIIATERATGNICTIL